jgi:hypothetical protein
MISLKPIKLEFSATIEVSVEEYIEHCEEYQYTPSQKGYENFVEEYVESELFEILDRKVEYGEKKEYEFEEPKEEPSIDYSIDYSNFVSDLTENEIKMVDKLFEEDKMIINPLYSKNDILIMNGNENLSLHYGVKLNKDAGEIALIKKSENSYFLYEYLRTLEELAQEHPTGAS